MNMMTKILIILLLAIAGLLYFTGNISFAEEIPPLELESKINEARQRQGLPSLSPNKKLRKSACTKAQDMKSKNYFEHISPYGVNPWDILERVGYSYSRAGENLAKGYATASGTVDGWLDSKPHRDLIYGDYSEQGTCSVGSYTVLHVGKS